MGLIFGIGAKPNVNYTKHTRLCGWWIWVPSMLPNHLVDARICQPILKENWKKCNLVESGSCKHTSNDKIKCIWLSIKFAQEAKNWFPDNSCQNWGITIVQAPCLTSVMLKDGEHKLLHCLQKSWWLEIVVSIVPSRVKSVLLIEPSSGNLNSFYPENCPIFHVYG